MAFAVKPSMDPRLCPLISFPEEENAFALKYLKGDKPHLAKERYDPDEVPGRVFLMSSHKAVPDFVAIHHRLGMSPEARALVEGFEPGVHQFLPVEVVRPGRSKRPVHRLDGRVLDAPYYLFIPQTILDAVWIERSEVRVDLPDFDPPCVEPRYVGRYSGIVLRRELTEGRHAWRGRLHLPGHVFFFDALVRAVKDRKLRGLECVRVEA